MVLIARLMVVYRLFGSRMKVIIRNQPRFVLKASFNQGEFEKARELYAELSAFRAGTIEFPN